MQDLFSYFFRRTPARRKTIAADTEAIDLAHLGGTINGTYLDIASVPALTEKARGKRPPPPPALPQPQPQPESARHPVSRPRRRADGNGAAPPERKSLLSVHSVEKSFVGRRVVRGVSLYVRKGEAVGLLGPNAPARPRSST